jgi:hypothetical protein
MTDRIMKFLANETGGKSYKAHKYSLDNTERPFIDYGENDMVWKRKGETRPYKTYIPLELQSIDIAKRQEQWLTYFLDGSRHVYKVDDIAYVKSGSRNVIYPVIAGQIGVGCCKRIDRIIRPERFRNEIVLSVPEIANADGKAGFFEAMTIKLNQIPVLNSIGINISNIIPYKISKNNDEKFEDRGTACIQDRMCQCEKEMVAELVRDGLLNHHNYLVKDGSLEYKPSKEIRNDKRKSQLFKNNYNYVIGVSKNFNPEICVDINGKPNPGFIADLPLYSRTPVAYYEKFELFGDVQFAVWYVRLRDKSRTRTPFDGIVKVEKMLVTHEEIEYGIDSTLVDILSSLIINERNPVCYGSDLRWANHIYPIFLTESYIKSKYLSTESFLHLF